jgi:hypothetical protein
MVFLQRVMRGCLLGNSAPPQFPASIDLKYQQAANCEPVGAINSNAANLAVFFLNFFKATLSLP